MCPCAAGAGMTSVEDMPVVVVEFPEYSGPAWFHTERYADGGVVGVDRRRWVPVPPQTRRCERGCCSRTGVPLVVAKAGSCHCCQGMSCGTGKAIEGVVGFWSADAEKRWPGILYVLASRCGRAEHLRLAAPGGGTVPAADFGAVGKGEIWQKTDREVRRLTGPVHQETRNSARRQHRRWYGTAGALGGFGSQGHWAHLVAQVVARGREHLEHAGARVRLGHMTERDIAAVQAVVDAWSQQPG